MRITAALCGLLGTLAPVDPAAAHMGRLSTSDLLVEDSTVVYRLRFAAHLVPGAQVDAAGRTDRRSLLARETDLTAWLAEGVGVSTAGRTCRPSLLDVLGPDANDDLSVALSYRCPRPVSSLRVDFHLFDQAAPDFRNVVSVRRGTQAWSHVFSPGVAVLELPAPGGRARTSGFAEFFVLGVEHILTGYDHLLFLLALLLPGGTLRRLAGIVTAFTVAHSITLALATLGVLTLPPRPVEVAIAASIVYVAAENLVASRTDHRWLVTFAFGLVHGFGFAGILREAGLVSGNTALPLLAFNLGVETGQIAVVAPAVPLLAVARRKLGERRVRLPLSWSVIACGLFWIIQRL